MMALNFACDLSRNRTSSQSVNYLACLSAKSLRNVTAHKFIHIKPDVFQCSRWLIEVKLQTILKVAIGSCF